MAERIRQAVIVDGRALVKALEAAVAGAVTLVHLAATSRLLAGQEPGLLGLLSFAVADFELHLIVGADGTSTFGGQRYGGIPQESSGETPDRRRNLAEARLLPLYLDPSLDLLQEILGVLARHIAVEAA